jgi:hypothetical protein
MYIIRPDSISWYATKPARIAAANTAGVSWTSSGSRMIEQMLPAKIERNKIAHPPMTLSRINVKLKKRSLALALVADILRLPLVVSERAYRNCI